MLQLTHALGAPILHALGGKEQIEWDNPFDVGMTGLIGFSSGYHAMLSCDTLVMLGTDFPYRNFYPAKAKSIQVDRRSDVLGRRTRLDLGVVGGVAETLRAVLLHIKPKTNRRFLETARRHYADARQGLDELATPSKIPPPTSRTRASRNGRIDWVLGIRVDDSADVEAALRRAFERDGPALVDVVTAKQQLVLPPKIQLEQGKGFSLFLLKAITNGRGDEVVALVDTNLRRWLTPSGLAATASAGTAGLCRPRR